MHISYVDIDDKGAYYNINTREHTNTGTSSNTVLRQVRLSHVDRKLCNSHDVYNGRLTDSMMCAGDLKGEVNACMVNIIIIVYIDKYIYIYIYICPFIIICNIILY